MRFPWVQSLMLGFTSVCLPLVGTQPVPAAEFITEVPTLHVRVPGIESQAQLADRLRAQGYADVIMSSVYPSPADPLPWRNPTLTSHPEQTPVRQGWNGVAVKDGQVIQVYVDR